MKILIPVDGSPTTKRMLAFLTTHGEWLGAGHSWTVLTVVPSVPPRAAAVIDKATLKSYYEDEAEKVFKPIRAFLKKQAPTDDVQFVSKVGAAADTVAQFATTGDLDLIVMGSHGQTNLMNLVMGSVATKVLAQCQVPVLLVR
jgi:nucleotide-binding universal stress UspA family protein